MKKIIFLALITFISCSNESDTLNESVQLNANEQEGDVLNNNIADTNQWQINGVFITPLWTDSH